VVSRPAGPTEAQRLAALLELRPLPGEGGLFRRTHLDAHSAAIYYLLVAPDFSALHTLAVTETYHFHAGSPLRLLLLWPDGHTSEPVLGLDLEAGQRPQLVVPAGVWQGSAPDGEWSLVGTTTAPAFDWSGFRLGERAELSDRYPAQQARIARLTRSSTGPAAR
jgi:predicted cupin superfamily sugar epimerase